MLTYVDWRYDAFKLSDRTIWIDVKTLHQFDRANSNSWWCEWNNKNRVFSSRKCILIGFLGCITRQHMVFKTNSFFHNAKWYTNIVQVEPKHMQNALWFCRAVAKLLPCYSRAAVVVGAHAVDCTFYLLKSDFPLSRSHNIRADNECLDLCEYRWIHWRVSLAHWLWLAYPHLRQT